MLWGLLLHRDPDQNHPLLARPLRGSCPAGPRCASSSSRAGEPCPLWALLCRRVPVCHRHLGPQTLLSPQSRPCSFTRPAKSITWRHLYLSSTIPKTVSIVPVTAAFPACCRRDAAATQNRTLCPQRCWPWCPSRTESGPLLPGMGLSPVKPLGFISGVWVLSPALEELLVWAQPGHGTAEIK